MKKLILEFNYKVLLEKIKYSKFKMSCGWGKMWSTVHAIVKIMVKVVFLTCVNMKSGNLQAVLFSSLHFG